MIGVRLDRVRSILARMEFEYRLPIDLEQSVTVAMWTADTGESSLDIEYEIRAGGEVTATAETDLVVDDDEGTGSRPIPEELA